MLDVSVTVDTEIWWQVPDLNTFEDDFARWFYGRTASGDFGAAYQIHELNRPGLKVVFFVEPLFACAVGQRHLEEMVRVISEGGHEIQLHIHTEWLELIDAPLTRQPKCVMLCSALRRPHHALFRHHIAQLRAADRRPPTVVPSCRRAVVPSCRRAVDRTVLGRFHTLCDFLAANRDRFRTVGFNDAPIEPSAAPGNLCAAACSTRRCVWASRPGGAFAEFQGSAEPPTPPSPTWRDCAVDRRRRP
jgi:hypothetical protein